MTQAFLIHPRDEETLKNMLCIESLPTILLEEVDLQTRMFHKSGASGPLGAMGLISIIRQLGMKPPRPNVQSGPTQWRQYKKGTRIEAFYFGNWMPGQYIGPAQNGMLCITLDEEPNYVKEARTGVVRLAKGAAELSAADFPPKDEGPDARITLLDRKPAVQPAVSIAVPADVTADTPVEVVLTKREGVTPESAILAAIAAYQAPEPAPIPTPTVRTPIIAKGGRLEDLPIRKRPTRETPDAEPETIDLASSDTDWNSIQPGAKVFFETDGDYKDAEFDGPAENVSEEDKESGPLYRVKVGDTYSFARPQELTLAG